MDSLLSVEEAARKLGGLSKYTIHAWLSSGKLRRTKVGSRTMIRESELERVIEDAASHQQHAHGDGAQLMAWQTLRPILGRAKEAPGRRKRRAIHYDPPHVFWQWYRSESGSPGNGSLLGAMRTCQPQRREHLQGLR